MAFGLPLQSKFKPAVGQLQEKLKDGIAGLDLDGKMQPGVQLFQGVLDELRNISHNGAHRHRYLQVFGGVGEQLHAYR